MPPKVFKKRRPVPKVSHRPEAINPSTTPSRRPNPLPSQYNFMPAVQAPLTQLFQGQVLIVSQQSTTAPHIGSYPPPQQLFQSIPPLSHREEFPNPSSEEVHNNPRPHQSTPLQDPHGSSLYTSHGLSHPSSQRNNFEQDESVLPDLEEDTLMTLNALLRVPDREMFATLLSPTPTPNSTWFTRTNYQNWFGLLLKFLQINSMVPSILGYVCLGRDKNDTFSSSQYKNPHLGSLDYRDSANIF